MKITKQRIREIVKETLSKRLEEQEPAAEPAAQGDEPRADIGKLIDKIINDGGDDVTTKKKKKIFATLSPEKKTRVIDVLVKQVLGIDLGDQYVKAGVQKAMQNK